MKKTLLVVDDELSIRLLLEHFLGDEYNVVTKDDGQKALDWISTGNHPDLILADIEMPALNGFELLDKIRMDNEMKGIPYLVVTGKGKSENYMKSFTHGANDYLQKPFSPEELKTRVHSILDKTLPAGGSE
jgi:DNA-binding response OmpR family regulator